MWCASTQPASARRPETRWRFHLSRCPGFGVHFYPPCSCGDLLRAPSCNDFANPKSSTLTMPSAFTFTLVGFRLPWMNPCAASRASAIWRAMGKLSSTLRATSRSSLVSLARYISPILPMRAVTPYEPSHVPGARAMAFSGRVRPIIVGKGPTGGSSCGGRVAASISPRRSVRTRRSCRPRPVATALACRAASDTQIAREERQSSREQNSEEAVERWGLIVICQGSGTGR